MARLAPWRCAPRRLAAKVEQLEQGKALQQPATAAAAGGEAHLLQHTLNEIVSCGSIEDVYK